MTGKTLNAANLEALGAARLAALLIEISTGDAAAKRRLRLALAGSAGSAEAAREVNKRLASIARAKGFLDWEKIKPFVADLEAQRRAILDLVGAGDPGEAFELIWRLVSCAVSVLERSNDGSGRLADMFHHAARDLGPLAERAKLDPVHLAERSFRALQNDSYGEWAELVPILAPQLGPTGLGKIKELIEAWQAEPIVIPPERERRVVGWSSSGRIYADQVETTQRRRIVAAVLKQIADASGDVDGYISQFDGTARRVPAIAAGIARRLLEAGRPREALQALEDVDHRRHNWIPMEWEQARIDTLEALGEAEQAQKFRLQRFMATLNAEHLRGYLRKLPDFEDFEAEQRAMVHALAFENVHQALDFLIAWPDLHRADQLVRNRVREVDGNLYELLSPAADALDEKHPLASTLVRRAMIDFTLQSARSSRYKHAARHLSECAAVAPRVTDFGGVSTHTVYEQSLRAAHGRKAGFWQEVDRLR